MTNTLPAPGLTLATFASQLRFDAIPSGVVARTGQTPESTVSAAMTPGTTATYRRMPNRRKSGSAATN